MSGIIVQTNGLSKYYGKIRAVDGVTLSIPRGSIYGLVGRNGAGKTTMLKMIAGLAYPTSGTFSIDDVVGEQLVSKNIFGKVGVLIEEPGLQKGLNAVDNLKLKALGLGLINIDPTVNELLALVGLTAAKMRKVKGYSLGMRQRLGIAMALIGNPEILILDEPINGLDPQGIVEIRNLFHTLQAQGKTLIISSHMLSELSRVATDYAFIDHGKIVLESSASNLEHLQTASYLLKTTDNQRAFELLSVDDPRWQLAPNGVMLTGDQPDLSKIIALLAQHNITMTSFNDQLPDIEKIFLQVTDNRGAIL